jgi:mRNA interferase MazF
MRQGEIWYADLNPTKGNEQSGLRPVAIISGNLLNQNLNIVMIVPLTTKIKRYKGNPILVPTTQNGLTQESEILVFHVRSIAKERLVRRLGQIELTQQTQAIKTLNDILKY